VVNQLAAQLSPAMEVAVPAHDAHVAPGAPAAEGPWGDVVQLRVPAGEDDAAQRAGRADRLGEQCGAEASVFRVYSAGAGPHLVWVRGP
jgi:hypothetical protein